MKLQTYTRADQVVRRALRLRERAGKDVSPISVVRAYVTSLNGSVVGPRFCDVP
jgi:hypothetical protein